MNSRYRLICLDAKTGQPVESFGDRGVVDLGDGLVWAINKKHYANTSPPVVYKDLVILGNGVGDRLQLPQRSARRRARLQRADRQDGLELPHDSAAGRVRQRHVGERVVGVHRPHQRLGADDARRARAGCSTCRSTTPSNDYYGGRRPGRRTCSASRSSASMRRPASGSGTSRSCTTACGTTTRRRRRTWSPSTVNGKTIDAVVQLTKQGFAFVFDRVTGEPVWPIEERPVPQSDVPGEETSPTQPFPTQPPAFTEQGVTLDDAFDLTPELKAEAQAEMKKYRMGPLYTPPSMQGTITRPGVWGGANWGGGAFDPETGMLYLKSGRPRRRDPDSEVRSRERRRPGGRGRRRVHQSRRARRVPRIDSVLQTAVRAAGRDRSEQGAPSRGGCRSATCRISART